MVRSFYVAVVIFDVEAFDTVCVVFKCFETSRPAAWTFADKWLWHFNPPFSFRPFFNERPFTYLKCKECQHFCENELCLWNENGIVRIHAMNECSSHSGFLYGHRWNLKLLWMKSKSSIAIQNFCMSTGILYPPELLIIFCYSWDYFCQKNRWYFLKNRFWLRNHHQKYASVLLTTRPTSLRSIKNIGSYRISLWSVLRYENTNFHEWISELTRFEILKNQGGIKKNCIFQTYSCQSKSLD